MSLGIKTSLSQLVAPGTLPPGVSFLNEDARCLITLSPRQPFSGIRNKERLCA